MENWRETRMRLLLDTNIFLELILEQKKSQEVRDLLLQMDRYEFFVTDFSTHSIGLILFRRSQYQMFLKFLDDVFVEGGVTILGLNLEDLREAVNNSQQFKLDFDDVYQYVAAEKYGLTLVSFDADFDRTKLGRKTPEEVLRT